MSYCESEIFDYQNKLINLIARFGKDIVKNHIQCFKHVSDSIFSKTNIKKLGKNYNDHGGGHQFC